MSAKFPSRCIQEANHGAGFIAEHKHFCASPNGGATPCQEPVKFHVRISYFCGNMCGKHKDKFIGRHKEAAVTDPIFVELN
jgi:hypothetical protein